MNTHSNTAETRTDELVDLGAASAEIKGGGTVAQDFEITQQQLPPMGLCAD